MYSRAKDSGGKKREAAIGRRSIETSLSAYVPFFFYRYGRSAVLASTNWPFDQPWRNQIVAVAGCDIRWSDDTDPSDRGQWQCTQEQRNRVRFEELVVNGNDLGGATEGLAHVQ